MRKKTIEKEKDRRKKKGLLTFAGRSNVIRLGRPIKSYFQAEDDKVDGKSRSRKRRRRRRRMEEEVMEMEKNREQTEHVRYPLNFREFLCRLFFCAFLANDPFEIRLSNVNGITVFFFTSPTPPQLPPLSLSFSFHLPFSFTRLRE